MQREVILFLSIDNYTDVRINYMDTVIYQRKVQIVQVIIIR